MKLKNIWEAPASSTLGFIIGAAVLVHFLVTGQWGNGHNALLAAASAFLLAPDRLKG
jgi:hypothetical protein